MSTTPRGRRFRPQELCLPSGKKVIASLPEDLPALRRQYSAHTELEVEVVVHGSDDHVTYLREIHNHQQGRRADLRRRYGDEVADEWEDTQRQLDEVSGQLEGLSKKDTSLSANFGKFGYTEGMRTYTGAGLGAKSKHSMPGTPAAGGGGGSGGGSGGDGGDDGDLEEGEHHRGATTKLIKMPVVKQWFHRGIIWRASEQTEIMAVELFLDLIYVGIIHSNGEHMSEEPTGYELLRFAITFIMSWKIWSEITAALSWFESDDIVTRLEVLFNISCLLGITTTMINSLSRDEEHSTWTMLVSFYLASRLMTVTHFAASAFTIPMIRGTMISSCLQILLAVPLWIGSIHVALPNRLILIWIAIVLDMYGQALYMGPFQYARNSGKDTKFGKKIARWFEYYPAPNIEHRVERTNAFVSLVLGYSVVGILFQSNGGTGLTAFFGKAIMGLMQAFFFNWIYFDVDSHNIEMHAIRRSAITMMIWTNAHLPFIMGYIVATSALSRLVLATDVPNTDPEKLTESYQELAEEHFGDGVRLFYCNGLAIALLCISIIGMTHSHRNTDSHRLSKRIRMVNRLVVVIIMFLLPLAKSLTSLNLIAVTLGLTVWVLAVELYGASLKGVSFVGETESHSVIGKSAKPRGNE